MLMRSACARPRVLASWGGCGKEAGDGSRRVCSLPALGPGLPDNGSQAGLVLLQASCLASGSLPVILGVLDLEMCHPHLCIYFRVSASLRTVSPFICKDTCHWIYATPG